MNHPSFASAAGVALCVAALSGCASSGSTPASSGVATTPSGGHLYQLAATPKTVAFGYYDAAATPVLHMQSGDEVDITTVLTNNPTGLARAGVDSLAIEQSLRDIYKEVPTTSRGPGGHVLTGPIYVEGADSGNVLEVRIESIDLAIPYAYNSFSPRSGFLKDEFTTSKTRIIPLDKTTGLAHFAPGIDIPMHPFFGSMGVAPPASMGKINSAPPGIHAGNLDNKELVAGTTLFIPIWTRGALFEVGDGHAGQGNGEVDITALETSLHARLRLIVRKDLHANWPRGETPTHYIAMGIDKDLATATKIAIREAIDFLATTKGLTREDAYMLVSVACDVDITQPRRRLLRRASTSAIPKAIFTSK